MPELPEVETVRRGLEPRLVGKRIVRLQQRRKDLRIPMPAKFASRPSARSSSVGWPTDSCTVSQKLLGARMRSFLPAVTDGDRSFSTVSSAMRRASLFRLDLET